MRIIHTALLFALVGRISASTGEDCLALINYAHLGPQEELIYYYTYQGIPELPPDTVVMEEGDSFGAYPYTTNCPGTTITDLRMRVLHDGVEIGEYQPDDVAEFTLPGYYEFIWINTNGLDWHRDNHFVLKYAEVTSIPDFLSMNNFQISTNGDLAYIRSDRTSVVDVKLYTMNGSLIFDRPNLTISPEPKLFSINKGGSGIYLLVIRSQNERVVHRLQFFE